MSNDLTPSDASALQKAAYYPVPSAGYLHVSGQDQVAFLQRQTTNDIGLVQPGRAVLTVLTTPTARILDVLYVLPGAGALEVITLPGRADTTARYLKSRVFFMDKVGVADASAGLAQVDLLGSAAPEILGRLGVGSELQPDQVTEAEFEGFPLRALILEPSLGLGVRLLLPADGLAAMRTFFVQAGAAPLSDEEYSIRRIEAGLPAAGAELSEEYTPLEAGLSAAISSTKGCFTGQEVIARQLTYDKVTQHLCGLSLARRAQPGERVWVADGSLVGKVTSAIGSPRFGEIALAVLKRPHHQPGGAISVGETFETAAEGQVVALPFGAD